MRIRAVIVLISAGVAAGVLAASANAALFFFFNPTSARPGEKVVIRTAGTPAGFTLRQRTRPFQQPMQIYLVSNTVASQVVSRDDVRLHYVGSLVPDKYGRGILRFRVPGVEPGDYAAAAWCPQCARYSNGRAFTVLSVDERIVPKYRRLMLLRVQAP